MKLLILILSSLSLNLLSDSVLERFNIIIKNDLTFNHRSLDSNNEISESVGSLIHDGEVILINVDSPFKERYQISDKTIDIYDFDFNQSRSISLNEFYEIQKGYEKIFKNCKFIDNLNKFDD